MKKINILALTQSELAFAIVFVALAVLFLALFVFAIVYYIIKNIKNDKSFTKQLSTTLHACFDLEKRTVHSFYKNRISKVRKYSIEKFIESIKPADQERVLKWLEDIKNNVHGTATFLRSSVPQSTNSNGKKNINPSNGLIELGSVNETRKKISVIIHKLSFTPFDQTKWSNNYSTIRRQLSFTLYGGQFPNALYFIKLSLTDTSGAVCIEEPVAYTLIVDRLSRETTSILNTELFELDEDLLLIVQTPTNPAFNYEEKGREWLRKVNQIISSNFWDLNIGASIGAITSDDSKQVRSLLEEGKKLANSASDEEGDEAIAFFSASRRSGADVVYRSAFSKILEGKSLACQFQPIINPSTGRTFGYHTKTALKNSTFEDMRELKLYASRHNLTSQLVIEYINNTINEFNEIGERGPYTRIFIDINPNEVLDVISAIPHIEKPNNIDLVFIINETEIDVDEANDRAFLAGLHALKQAGPELAILLENDQFPELSELYKRFDFFIPPNVRIEHRNKDENYAPVFYTRLLEKLLVFKKPVISINVQGWPRVELLIRLGIDYISSDEISPYTNSPREIDKRKLIRLNRFAE